MRSELLLRTCLLAALVVISGISACAPGIEGQWKGTGEVDRDHRFELDMTLNDKVEGYAIYTAAAGVAPRTLNICSGAVEDSDLQFKLDLAGREVPCSGYAQRYQFTGVLGHDVITGKIMSTAGEPMGRWRAFRVKTD